MKLHHSGMAPKVKQLLAGPGETPAGWATQPSFDPQISKEAKKRDAFSRQQRVRTQRREVERAQAGVAGKPHGFPRGRSPINMGPLGAQLPF